MTQVMDSLCLDSNLDFVNMMERQSMFSINDVMNDGLLWIDVETTGTDGDSLLLEVAMQSTDMYGMIMDSGCHAVIHHDTVPDSIMDDTVKDMHTKNGLLDEVVHAGISSEEASHLFREYVDKSSRRFDVMYLAGYTVSFDRRMIQRMLPGTIDDMQHRMVDLTALNIIAEHFLHDFYKNADGKYTDHRSPHCIQMEMDRYRYYISGIMSMDMNRK